MTVDRSPDSVLNKQISGNTAKDGSGTEYRILVTADGHVLFVPTDGTNNLFDAVTRAGWVQIGDGTRGPVPAYALNAGIGATQLGLTVAAVLKALAPNTGNYQYLGMDSSTNRNLNTRIRSAAEEANVSGEALHVKRGHADSASLALTTSAQDNLSTETLQNAVISATLDVYIYNITLQLVDAAVFNNLTGEGYAVIIDGAASIPEWNNIAAFDKGDVPAQVDGNYYLVKSWNLATPIRIPANTTVTIYGINATGNQLDTVRLRVHYYLE